jgi:hypothetical protein
MRTWGAPRPGALWPRGRRYAADYPAIFLKSFYIIERLQFSIKNMVKLILSITSPGPFGAQEVEVAEGYYFGFRIFKINGKNWHRS